MSSVEKFTRTEEEQKRCIQIHDASRAELLKRQLSNSENYDKAILSLSSAALALSLTAIKFIVPIASANYLWALKFSWFLFFITITLSLVAFLVGNQAITKQLSIEEDYYINAIVKAQSENNIYSKINSRLNKLTGIVFIIAIFLVIFFVTINIQQENDLMSKKDILGNKTPLNVKLRESADISKMRIAPGNGSESTASADIPKMQLAPGVQPAKKSSQSAGSSSGNSGNAGSSNQKSHPKE